jgi:hypothetical protein
VRPWILFLLLVTGGTLFSCQRNISQHASPTYGEAYFLPNNAVSEIQNSDNCWVDLNTDWLYLGADSLSGIYRNFPNGSQASQLLSLPHRLNLPNHSMWYAKEVFLAQGILQVSGDDGVQVWVNEKQVHRSRPGNQFELLDSGRVLLQVRVINNAMAGGLRKVQWVSRDDYSVMERQASRTADSLHVLRKVQVLQNQKLKKSLSLRKWEEQSEATRMLPVLLAEPVVLLGADGSWFVRWVSEQPGEARVVLATGEAVLLTSTTGIFTLPVLDKDIAFRLYQADAYQGQHSFKVPRVDADSIRVALWGDSQGGWGAFAQMAEQVKRVGVDLSIGAGDLVANGSEAKSYVSFLQVLSGMQSPQLLVPGNHDYDGNYDILQPKALRAYLMRDSEPTYGFHRIGPLAVMTLDPNAYFPVSLPVASAQREALEAVLASPDWQEAPWRTVVLHQPPYSQGWPGYHGEYSIREVLEPYFHQGWIDLVVAGHTHNYERLQLEFSGHMVNFFVVGGGGGGLEPEGIHSAYPVMDRLIKKHHVGILQLDKNQMHWSVLDLEGQVLDSLHLVKKRQ